MKHLKTGRKFSRLKKQREALLKTLLGSLLIKKKLTSTEAKVKELVKNAEEIANKISKIPSLTGEAKIAKMRMIKKKLPANFDSKAINELAKLFTARKSGFFRIIKTGRRKSDGAKIATIEILKSDN